MNPPLPPDFLTPEDLETWPVRPEPDDAGDYDDPGFPEDCGPYYPN